MARISAYKCDFCGEIRPGDRDEPPVGLRGTVAEDTGGGGVGAVKWFACSPEHVWPAIQSVLTGAWDRAAKGGEF